MKAEKWLGLSKRKAPVRLEIGVNPTASSLKTNVTNISVHSWYISTTVQLDGILGGIQRLVSTYSNHQNPKCQVLYKFQFSGEGGVLNQIPEQGCSVQFGQKFLEA